MKELVLVTGGSGYIASNIIIQLLKEGYGVRTTVRSLDKIERVKKIITAGGIKNLEDLSFIETDLSSEKNWDKAMEGITYVIHPASPTPKLNFKDEKEMIDPAVNGVLYVMKAARDAKVKRAVLTSAYGAIFAGHEKRTTPYTEEDWSNLDAKNIFPYQKSKTLSERAAWKFIEEEGNGMELTTVNPVAVMGPILTSDYSHSNIQIQQLLAGEVKAVPNVDSGYVDVRDVASLHVLAMTSPKAAGERFLATTGETLSMLEVASILREAFPAYDDKLPTKKIPNAVLKAAAVADPSLRMVASLTGKYAGTSNQKAKTLLGWEPRSAKEAILATAQSMIDLGIVKK